MPVRILYIEPNITLQESFKELVKQNKGLTCCIIDDMDLLDTELEKGIYTHLVLSSTVIKKIDKHPLDFVKIPILVLTKDEIDVKNNAISYTELPLSYPKLFSFLCEHPIISYDTLNKYAMGDEAFMTQMKGHIIDEFEINVSQLPQLFKNKDVNEIKSKAHKIASKFSLLEMEEAFHLSKEIDTKILDNPNEQIKNMQYLLVDIEIALTQLK
jgi:hypothetical protein